MLNIGKPHIKPPLAVRRRSQLDSRLCELCHIIPYYAANLPRVSAGYLMQSILDRACRFRTIPKRRVGVDRVGQSHHAVFRVEDQLERQAVRYVRISPSRSGVCKRAVAQLYVETHSSSGPEQGLWWVASSVMKRSTGRPDLSLPFTTASAEYSVNVVQR